MSTDYWTGNLLNYKCKENQSCFWIKIDRKRGNYYVCNLFNSIYWIMYLSCL